MIVSSVLLLLFGAALSVLFSLRVKARDRLWLDALAAIVAGDYVRAEASATELQEQTETPYVQKESADALIRISRMIEGLQIAERKEYQARHEMQDVLAALQDAVIVVNEDARIRFLNVAAVRFFDVKVTDILGAHALEAVPSLSFESALNTALRDGQDSAQEIRFYSPRDREVLLRVTPIRRSDGRVSGAVAILQDLTKMRYLERVRRDFVANASHELRTPIANIRAVAETVLGSPDDPALVPRFLPQLLIEAERLSRLVSDLLDLARAETVEQTSVAQVDLGALVEEVVERLKDKAARQNIEVHTEPGNQSPQEVVVRGDAAGLEQVVFNLLDNALIYTPPGGSVTIELRAEWEEGQPATVSLCVSDTGIGIPEDDLARIFERFYRVDKAHSRGQSGTGLGLAIVKHIVENHRGHLGVSSVVGQGTTFTVTLPASVAPESTPEFTP